MWRFKTLRRGLVAGLAIAGLLLVAAAVVMASTSSGPEKVCVPTKAGKPVITATNAKCKAGYNLNEIGKEGPTGKEGPAGKGATGATAPAGPEGKVPGTGVKLCVPAAAAKTVATPPCKMGYKEVELAEL